MVWQYSGAGEGGRSTTAKRTESTLQFLHRQRRTGHRDFAPFCFDVCKIGLITGSYYRGPSIKGSFFLVSSFVLGPSGIAKEN